MNIPRNPTAFGHRVLGGVFLDGSPATSGVPLVQAAALGGAKNATLRFRSSVAGTLALAYLRPTPDGAAYTTGQPADTAITADTEVAVSLTPNGHALLRVTFTPSATGTITYADLITTD